MDPAVVLANGARCKAMVGSALRSSRASPMGKVPSSRCRTAFSVDPRRVNAALSHCMTWCKLGLEYPGGASHRREEKGDPLAMLFKRHEPCKLKCYASTYHCKMQLHL